MLIGQRTSLKSCKCEGCVRPDCGKCKMCLDKPKYGGPGKKKQRCLKRQCLQRSKSTSQNQKVVQNDNNATNVVKGFSICITQSDMATLTGHLTWLNDQVAINKVGFHRKLFYIHSFVHNEILRISYCCWCYSNFWLSQIINFYFNIIVSEFNKRDRDSEIYTFNTHFYHKLSTSGFEGVKKWTKKVLHNSILLNLRSPSVLYRLIFLSVSLYLSLYTLDVIGHWWSWTAEMKKSNIMILLVEVELLVHFG